MQAATPRIAFIRLTATPIEDVLALLNEPRNARHMPLATQFDEASAAGWVQAKDAQWHEHGYGPWSINIDGHFAGWGGFQLEDGAADLALVLMPAHWGEGAEIVREALGRGFTELGLDRVTIALPRSRTPGGAVARLGFTYLDEVDHDGVAFRRYELTKKAWETIVSHANYAATTTI